MAALQSVPLYTGSLATDMVQDITDSGGIIDEEDFRGYTVGLDVNSEEVELPNMQLKMIVPPAPSSGNLLAYTLGIYSASDNG